MFVIFYIFWPALENCMTLTDLSSRYVTYVLKSLTSNDLIDFTMASWGAVPLDKPQAVDGMWLYDQPREMVLTS